MARPSTSALMAQALALTKQGKLSEAAALLQSGLRGPAKTPPQEDVVEGSFTRLNDPPAGAPAASAPLGRARKSGLAETLRRLAAGGMPARGPLAEGAAPLPEGATFLRKTYQGPDGRRDYRLYVPARQTGAPMPLIVMLHGCTQSPEDFALGTGMNALAEEFGCLVAYPAQPSGANMQKCWNWFRPEDQARGGGEPALIAGLTREVLQEARVDPARVYIAGLSAGGAAAAQIASAYPELFSAVGVHSGLPLGAAQDVAGAFAAMRGGAAPGRHVIPVPTISFHGSADSTVHPANGQAVVAQALRARPGLHPSVSQGQSPGGRRYTRSRHLDSQGRPMAELWEIEGAGHAWSGGQAAGSYTDPQGPDASREMLSFFLRHGLKRTPDA